MDLSLILLLELASAVRLFGHFYCSSRSFFSLLLSILEEARAEGRHMGTARQLGSRDGAHLTKEGSRNLVFQSFTDLNIKFYLLTFGLYRTISAKLK
jgi:hypothetical protein